MTHEIAVAFEPIDRWEGVLTPPDQRRSRHTFRATYSETVDTLLYELGRLDVREVTIQLALGWGDIRRDGLPRAHAKPSHPGVVVEFEHPKLGRRVRYATDAHTLWEHNLRAIALTLEALRGVDRYGTTSRGEQYAGWQRALPAPGVPDVERGRAIIRAEGGRKGALRATHEDTRLSDSSYTDEDFRAVQAAIEAGAGA